MKEQLVSRIALYILAAVLIIFGIYHFKNPQNLINYVPEFLPGGIIWVYVVGAAFILAAIAFFTHKYIRLAAYLLALLLVILVLTVHVPNYLNSGDVDQQKASFVNILKDLSMAAFSLFIGANANKI